MTVKCLDTKALETTHQEPDLTDTVDLNDLEKLLRELSLRSRSGGNVVEVCI